jgi:hypothetical protein
MTPQQLRAKADALDALRPGFDGWADGWDTWDENGVKVCSQCRVRKIADTQHRHGCRNVALSASLHDGAQALRREAALIEWLGDNETCGDHLLLNTRGVVLSKLSALHADPAGQER